MKIVQLTVVLLALSLAASAQTTLTGLWTGTLSNDSFTIRKDQSFEIVLTQYKDKVFGYSRTTFFVRDTLYYIVKRVKGTIEGDVCEVKDDEVLKHNFPTKPEKGVKQISVFRRNPLDSAWTLDGDWKTTESKKHRYYSVSGKMSLKEEPDIEKSKIIPHLEELKLTDDIAVYQEAKQKEREEIAAAASIKQKQPELTSANRTQLLVKEEKKAGGSAPDVAKTVKKEPAITPVTTSPIVTTEAQKERTAAANDQPVASASQTRPPAANPVQPSQSNEPQNKATVVKTTPVSAPVSETGTRTQASNAGQKPVANNVATTDPAKTEQAGTISPVERKEPLTQPTGAREKSETSLASTKPQTPANSMIVTAPIAAATRLEERKIGAQQVVYFKSDSLELALYDNGEIDGDTVSILVNGALVMEKQGLKATAIKKTIYLPAGQADSVMLELYAENLGKYPPNTGLLVVHDGDDTYQVRFSADLKQNAAVIFKRKRE